jgi:hypothetical protein
VAKIKKMTLPNRKPGRSAVRAQKANLSNAYGITGSNRVNARGTGGFVPSAVNQRKAPPPNPTVPKK